MKELTKLTRIMKPIREYLQELPAPYNTLALSVVDENYEGYLAEVEYLHQAIVRMCDWGKTPQRCTFWNNVANWCINPNDHYLPAIPAVEVSPEVEQPKTEMESCLDKKLSDNPTIADSIGSHMQLAFKYSKELVNENTRLRAQLYRLPILEQENAQLKAPLTPTGRLHVKNLEQENTELRADKERIVDLLNKAQITIAELESQLLSNPKELVHDAEWLANVVNNYDDIYWLSGETVSVGGVTLSPKDSAPIIMAALAKELNCGKTCERRYRITLMDNGKVDIVASTLNQGDVYFYSKPTAQKAIGILTQIDPQVLKNYFA